jgi:hypothetical protein
METSASTWRKCSVCKKIIALGGRYYVCSVSTCNGLRTGYSFCSMQCFETHLPGARHKNAGAIEKKAPLVAEAPSSEVPVSTAEPKADLAASATTPQRVFAKASSTTSPLSSLSSPGGKGALPREVLVIASRLKDYIQARSEFNTSASVMDVLSDQLRVLCDRAIDNARSEGRKTVLDRDFDFLKK